MANEKPDIDQSSYVTAVAELATNFDIIEEDWEREFIQRMRVKESFTIGMKAKIADLVYKYLSGPPRSGNNPPPNPLLMGRVKATKESNGWQLHLDDVAIGDRIAMNRIREYVVYLHDSLPQIEAVIKSDKYLFDQQELQGADPQ
jgi:hypothetical protein